MTRSIDEALLTKIWCRHFSLDEINRNDDFFNIGGTSLQAIQVFSEIEEETGIDLPISVLIEAPTIGELVEYIQQKQDTEDRSLVLLRSGENRLKVSKAALVTKE